MLKMGLPVDAVKNALLRDQKDPSIMDLDHSRSLKSQTNKLVIDTGVPLKDDPEFAKVSYDSATFEILLGVGRLRKKSK